MTTEPPPQRPEHAEQGHRFEVTPDPERPGQHLSRCQDCGHIISIPDMPKLRVYLDIPIWHNAGNGD